MTHRALALLAAVLLATKAEAALTVCNKAGHPARMALGRFDGRDWASQGWWRLAPGQCADVVTGKLDARYYYLYATDGDAGVWDGNTGFAWPRRRNSRFRDAATARAEAMIASDSSASTPTTT